MYCICSYLYLYDQYRLLLHELMKFPSRVYILICSLLLLFFSISLSFIRHWIVIFRNKPTVLKKHNGIVQLGLAAIQALEQPACGTQDRLLAVEKGLLQSIDNGDFTRVVTQLTSMVNKESEKEPQDR